MSEFIQVVAGVIESAGRFLLAQRPPGRDHAGCWEFPGGKIGSGESPQAALVRELDEELGIHVEVLDRLITVPFCKEGQRLLLDSYRVKLQAGEPQGREGQALVWVDRAKLSQYLLPPADYPVAAALLQSCWYPITPEPGFDENAWLERIARWAKEGRQRIQLRIKKADPSRRYRLLRAAVDHLRRANFAGEVLLNEDITLARELGLGVHLTAAQIQALAQRPLSHNETVAASCHNAGEIAAAARLDVNFITLSPVRPTLSHATAVPLGWKRFAALRALTALPVYALGGLNIEDLAEARQYGAQGIAGVGTFN